MNNELIINKYFNDRAELSLYLEEIYGEDSYYIVGFTKEQSKIELRNIELFRLMFPYKVYFLIMRKNKNLYSNYNMEINEKRVKSIEDIKDLKNLKRFQRLLISENEKKLWDSLYPNWNEGINLDVSKNVYTTV